jgi:arylsulfatase A-like enzyme/Tfp pilus assembly protein PilF
VPPAQPAHPNILLVTIDTFRADRVGIGLTPAIERLAASGLRFTQARTAVPLTLPSHTTIHTGLLPPAHGVRENGIGALLDSHQTIARLLKGAGYDTAAFVGAFVLDHRFGLSQGFDTYDDQIPRDPEATDRLEAERPASAVVDRALAWLEGRTPGPKGPGRQNAAPSPQPPAPFFLWLHLYDPHAPYTPPQEFLVPGRTPYDGEIAYADAQLGRLIDRLRAAGLMEHTVVVVAGDHGEGLGEHGERTHGMLVYDSTLRVPLVIGAPGRTPATSDEPVSLVDVAPTVLRAAGIAPPNEMNGRDLLDTVRLKPDTTEARRSNSASVGLQPDRGSGSVRLQADRSASSVRLQPDRSAGSVRLQPDRDLYSETEYPRVAGWSPLQALTDGRWMTIRAGLATEVYDLRADPREEHDIFASQAAVGAAMSARAGAIHASAAAPGARTISPEAQERLRSLGYVASSTQAAPAADAPNPAARIATWNEFEDALSALSSHRPDAVVLLRRLAAANPDAAVIQTMYARALKEAGQIEPALAAYRAAAKRWPTDADILHDLAVTAREAASAQGPRAAALRDEAMRADQAALTLEPNSGAAHNGLGLLAIDAGKPADAVKAFERAAAIDSNNASYWVNLGNARRAIGDRAGAEQAYRRALETDARAADAANGLGVLLVEANRAAEATPWFERAVAAAPDLVEAHLNLGIALQTAGRPDRAAEEYRRVLAARGSHPREKDAAAKLLAAIGRAR